MMRRIPRFVLALREPNYNGIKNPKRVVSVSKELFMVPINVYLWVAVLGKSVSVRAVVEREGCGGLYRMKCKKKDSLVTLENYR